MRGLSLEETNAISEMAKLLYSFLPGNPHPFADQKISFKGVATDLGIGSFWREGSKLPSITTLLEMTLQYKRDKFCDLILEIVKRGIKYRTSKGEKITRGEVERLNELLLKVEFKIPELWNRSFLKTLPSESNSKKDKIETEVLDTFKRRLLYLTDIEPQKRGYEFEKFLQEIFELFKLSPRSAFRITGEQIDGSIELDSHTYLIEAKWQNTQVNEKDLLSFYGKIEGKAKWSRGLFISYSGFTEGSIASFPKGKKINLILMDGRDLYEVLEGKVRLDVLIRLKSRYAAETGEIMVRVDDLKFLYKKDMD